MLQDFFGVDCSYQENLLTEYYVKMGFEVVVISSTFESVFDYTSDNYNNKLKRKELVYKGGKIIRLPYQINILNKLRRHKGVYDILQIEKPDLIYLHDIHLNVREAVIYKRKHPECKIIMDYHTDYSNSAKNWLSLNILHKIIRKKIFYKYINCIDRIFPITPLSATFLHEVYGVPFNKMELLPLGCDYDLALETMKKTKKDDIKQYFNIKNDDFVIISGGKLEPVKKTELIIDALKITKNDKNIHLIIFGEHSKGYEKYYRDLIERARGLNVHFTGWITIEKILEIMTISNLAIFPSSQSVLWQQSIGMHLPLIVGDLGGQNAGYLNRENNLISLPKEKINATNIAEHINNFISNPSLEYEMRKRSQKVASEYIDYRIICKKTLSVLQ